MSIFSKIQLNRPQSSTFNLSHQRKFTCDMGYLVPILCQETLPGDKWDINSSQIARLQPMLTPMMHDVDIFIHYFHVPNRILFDGWEKFITGGESGLEQVLLPTMNMDKMSVINGSNFDFRLADYLGLPVKSKSVAADLYKYGGEQISILPFLAYQKIYNEFYRDQNLTDNLDDDLFNNVIGGINNQFNNSADLFTLRKRAWKHDYFTSALPFAQKGSPVTIPLGKTAPLITVDGSSYVRDADGNLLPYGTHSTSAVGNFQSGGYNGAQMDVTEHTLADLSNASSSSVTDLRRAFKLQEWLEKNARAGSRYVESLLSHFGVRSSDGRLQRPEFLGGSSSPMMISEVLQTSQTDSSPQGNMAGHGLNLGNGGNISKYFEEHGIIIGIMSVMPKPEYSQGIPKMFSKNDKFSFFWPEFEHVGEQPILNKELYNDFTDNKNDDIFGYLPRYSEYKYIPNTVHGEFKTTLDFWHMGRIFAKRPHLNNDFISCSPTNRTFAVPDEENKVLVQLNNSIKCKRLMTYYSDPRFL